MASKQVATKSSNKVYIYSTLANSQIFVAYEKPAETGMLPIESARVVINGGAGIASKNLITKSGVPTIITQEEFDAISNLHHFKSLVESGHIRFEKKDYDIEAMIGDMNPRDPGGPLTPSDYETTAKDGSTAIPVELEKAGSGWVANQLSNR